MAEIQVELELRDEIVPRAQNIRSRLDRQTIETEEVQRGAGWVGPATQSLATTSPALPAGVVPNYQPCASQVNKTLKATLQALLELVALDDGDVPDSSQASPSTESLKSTGSDLGGRQAGRKRSQQQETETFYITVGMVGSRQVVRWVGLGSAVHG